MTTKTIESHWARGQRDLLQRCLDAGDVIAFVCTDAHGLVTRRGRRPEDTPGYPGLVQDLGPGYPVPFSDSALHGTRAPHRWPGCRVWICAFGQDVVERGTEVVSRRRTWIGNVAPSEALDSRIGVRLGRLDLAGANLQGAVLPRTDLTHADLADADLRRSELRCSRLVCARLRRTDLRDAKLDGADLSGALVDRALLNGADLRRARLSGADLRHARLSGADLAGASLELACLVGTDLAYVGLSRTDLTGADLAGADLTGADLTGAELEAAGFARANLAGARVGEKWRGRLSGYVGEPEWI